jgi:hypothetical protein
MRAVTSPRGHARIATAGPLLNAWFTIAAGFASSFHHHAQITSYTWAQYGHIKPRKTRVSEGSSPKSHGLFSSSL